MRLPRVPLARGQCPENHNSGLLNGFQVLARVLQMRHKLALFPRTSSRSGSLTQVSFSADGNGRRASEPTSPWIKISIGSAKMFHCISRLRTSTQMFRCTLGTRCGTPCMVVGIEVQDAAGHPLPVNERFPNSSICTGHGRGPRPFPKSKVVPLERKLRAEGWLPNHPGTYTIILTWSPCFGPGKTTPTGWIADLKPYTVVHEKATIHVLSEAGSVSN
jgi:hypothetical protein